ncbi:hypothetical protein LNP74_32420 [Klebsiella pneumoniae subsp. pneumoniae]|nr:hypothetical protein [Klebsiella pneumoniae subsp. pneumoniae]
MLCAFPNIHLRRRTTADPDDRGGQPLCRTLHWRDSDPARAVSPRWGELLRRHPAPVLGAPRW